MVERADEQHMRLALDLAQRARGRTSPNPMVGAVLVREDRVIGTGYHERAGLPHAEVVALRNARGPIAGATLYVTLEPCAHTGRTPPCTDVILQHRVGRVVGAMADPNPRTGGRGAAQLRAHGVEVELGLLEVEARRVNEAFTKYITTGRPFVTVKVAQTLDGKIATQGGDSQWITGPAARAEGHRLRGEVDAVIVGVNTILRDNPRLTARQGEDLADRQPARVVLDSRLRTPPTCALLAPPLVSPVLIVTTRGAPPEAEAALRARGAQVVVVPEEDGRVSVPAVLAALGRMEMTHVLVEGGAGVISTVLRAGLADKVIVCIAPAFAGDPGAKGYDTGQVVERVGQFLRLREPVMRQVGQDVVVEGYLPCSPAS